MQRSVRNQYILLLNFQRGFNVLCLVSSNSFQKCMSNCLIFQIALAFICAIRYVEFEKRGLNCLNLEILKLLFWTGKHCDQKYSRIDLLLFKN